MEVPVQLVDRHRFHSVFGYVQDVLDLSIIYDLDFLVYFFGFLDLKLLALWGVFSYIGFLRLGLNSRSQVICQSVIATVAGVHISANLKYESESFSDGHFDPTPKLTLEKETAKS